MRNSTIRRINNAVRRLDMVLVKDVLNPPDGSDGAPFELCAATRDDWKRYVQSELQEMGSCWMTWWDDRVFIVELPEGLHEDLVDGVREAIIEATGTRRTHLMHRGKQHFVYNPTLPEDINDLLGHLEPDSSFGPVRGLPGAVLPPGFTWRQLHTLEVEIGVYRCWGDRIPQEGQRFLTLNETANAWRQCPGVEYVLSIRVDCSLAVHEYRLDSIVDGEFENPEMEHAPIETDTVVQFDSWRLLAIPHGANLPPGFNDSVQFNLFDVVNPIIQQERDELAQLQAVAAAAGQPPRPRQRRH